MADGSAAPAGAPLRAERPCFYLVTGGCGFIGAHLVRALVARGDVVRVLDDLSSGRRDSLPAGVEFLYGDIAEPDTVRHAMQEVDGCFHLAEVASVAQSHQQWLTAHRANLTGTINVFDAARRRRSGTPTPVVYASSAAVYGDHEGALLDEALSTRPLSSYGADKVGCEMHARIARAVHAVPNLGLRFFNVYGPQHGTQSGHSGVIATFCERLRAGRGLTLFGDGGQTRDFVYVDDAVMALLEAMAHLPAASEVVNICTGRGITIRALAEAMAALQGTVPAISSAPPRPGDIRFSVGDPARAKASLSFVAAVELSDGLARTLAAYAPA